MNGMKTLRKIEPRVVVPLALGVMFALGDEASNPDGFIVQNRNALIAKAVLLCVLFCILFRFAEKLVAMMGKTLKSDTDEKERHGFFEYGYSVKPWLKNAVVIAVCWLPYEIWLFPGVYWSDTSKQLLIHYGVEPFTDHHPFVLTYLFGWLADFGQWAFHNPIYGLYLLIVVQLIAAPLIFSWMLLYTRKIGVPQWLCHVELAFMALFPLLPVMFSSLAKDTISALFFMPFCILFVDAIRTKGSLLVNPWVVIAILLCGLLTCLTKKAGVYVVVPSLLLMFLINGLSKKAKGIAFAIGAVIAVIMMVIIPKAVMPALGVAPGGKQESIPFAIQQVAHDIKYNSDDMTPQEKKLVSDFLTIEYKKIPQAYDPQIADPVKGTSLKNPDLFSDFMRLWLKKTAEHPIGHLESWMGLVRGWFSFSNNDGSPDNMVVCTESAWYYKPILKYVPQWPLKSHKSDTARSVYDMEQSVPVLNVLFSRALWASILPCFMLYLALCPGRGKWSRVASMLPVDMSFAYLLLVPVSGMGGEPTRYVLQLICIAPLFLAFMSSMSGTASTANDMN
ncbi:DUF6020 family protein [Bifidobacterium angulatum]